MEALVLYSADEGGSSSIDELQVFNMTGHSTVNDSTL